MAETKSHASSRSKAVLGGKGKSKSKSSKGSKHPHEIRIRAGKSGGHIVTHHHLPSDDGAAQEPEEHVLPDQAAMLQHVADNTENNPAPAPTPDPAAMAAQAGPAAAGPQAAPPGM